MFKKSIVLLLVFLISGLLLVHAQDTVRLQQIQREIEQLTADFQAGKITPQEFQRRALELQSQAQAAQQGMQREVEQASSSYRYSDAQMRRLLELHDQSKKIIAQFNEGRISEAEAARQSEPLKREIEQINAPFQNLSRTQTANLAQQQQDLEKQLKQLWPGAAPGWPRSDVDNSYVKIFMFNRSLRQASGIRASWSSYTFGAVGPIGRYTIFQTGANPAAMEDLKRQVESITGKTMQRLVDTGHSIGTPSGYTQNGYYLEYPFNEPDANGWYDICRHSITLVDGTLQYSVDIGLLDNIHSKDRKEKEL